MRLRGVSEGKQEYELGEGVAIEGYHVVREYGISPESASRIRIEYLKTYNKPRAKETEVIPTYPNAASPTPTDAAKPPTQSPITTKKGPVIPLGVPEPYRDVPSRGHFARMRTQSPTTSKNALSYDAIGASPIADDEVIVRKCRLIRRLYRMQPEIYVANYNQGHDEGEIALLHLPHALKLERQTLLIRLPRSPKALIHQGCHLAWLKRWKIIWEKSKRSYNQI